MKIAYVTLGCKVNHYETQAMQELFQSAGWTAVPFGEPCDAVVINTCSVTQMSDKKSRQLISRAHRDCPEALIVVTGCYAQTAAESVKALPGVGLVVGNEGKSEIVRLVTEALEGLEAPAVTDILKARSFEELSAIRDGRTRACLKIQDGCCNYCTYCIIPYARGPIRSRTPESCERELRRLAEEGFREVVLTGIHLASYGLDFPADENGKKPELIDILKIADGIPGLERIRIGSLEPKYCTERVANAIAAMPHVCRQFHLSLQSGSDTVLKRMKRRYTTAEFEQAVNALRAAMPDCAITTDVIAGFAGETEEEHRESLAFCEKIGFARMHCFPYSRRPGTVADKMDGQLGKAVKEARCKELIALGEKLEAAYIDRFLGTVQTVIAEDDGTGYTGNYIRVRCGGNEGEERTVRLTAREKDIAIGEPVR
ncbi:MAG: tRNA (N(6)-L-threonylcarbamoyladenosine(37)-C(2))-methylthiotransferase MtaB [Clostridia bacterium]|nr:tRNA (N(6)-L-threonylcarbamoyladenosine(37)-C(2))-methylthiotransferase MtaB [Clostridia bacterium]